MLKERLLKEVAVPIWYGLSNLVKLSLCEEALYAYLSCIITSICFAVDCWDITVDTLEWASTTLVGEAPAVEEVLIDETLYLSGTTENVAEEVLQWWVEKAFDVFVAVDVVVAEYWNTPILCGVDQPKALPAYKRRKNIKFLKK